MLAAVCRSAARADISGIVRNPACSMGQYSDDLKVIMGIRNIIGHFLGRNFLWTILQGEEEILHVKMNRVKIVLKVRKT